MEKAKILEQLIKEQGYTIRAFAKKCDIPESTLYTILKKGVGRASVNTIILICKNLGIRVEDLEEMENGAPKEQFEPSFDDIQTLIARNGRSLTLEQKQALIKSLLSDD